MYLLIIPKDEHTMGVGTLLWMAPEVKTGTSYGFPSDVYSLGLVLYELFEGKLPEYDRTTQKVTLPDKFRSSRTVLPCLHPDPKKRPSCKKVASPSLLLLLPFSPLLFSLLMIGS